MKKEETKNTSTLLCLLAITVGMFGLAFASVPLYRLFCQVTGFAGTTQASEEIPSEVLDREITIRFNSDVSPNVPWKFKPNQKAVKVHVGENKLVSFSAINEGVEPITGTSVYNVTPLKVGLYFNKVQCFCFNEQTINPGEKVTFPVSFYIDPEIINDKNLEDVTTITLSYTFFKAKES